MSDNRLRVLVVDNEEKERCAIRNLLKKNCTKYTEGWGSRLDFTDLGTPEEVGSLVEELGKGLTPYHFIFCDVFMPLPGGGEPVKEGGWRRLFDALQASYQTNSRTNNAVYLVAITHMPTPELCREINRLIEEATRECGKQWAFFFPKPDIGVVEKPPPEADRLIAAEAWFQHMVHALKLVLDGHELVPWLGKIDAEVVAESSLMKEAIMKVKELARDNQRVIAVIGEPGAGKEVLAKEYHRAFGLKDETFLAVHVNTLPPTLLESTLFGARKGIYSGSVENVAGLFGGGENTTVFLDEVGTDLECTQQLMKMLHRLLQSGESFRPGDKHAQVFKGRVILAGAELTMDLDQFSEALKRRIPRECRVEVPPLRARRSEIRPLFERLMKKHADKEEVFAPKIEPDVWDLLQTLPWKGNVGALINVMHWAVKYHDPPVSRRKLEEHCPSIREQLAVTIEERFARFRSRNLSTEEFFEAAKLYVEDCRRDKSTPTKVELAKRLGCTDKTIRNHGDKPVSTGRTLDEELDALGFSEGGAPKKPKS